MKFSISDLHVQLSGKKILNGINLSIKKGEVHALMGPNGSGKSTLSFTLMGHPAYTVTKGRVLLGNKNILSLPPEKRAKEGLFLAFQKPLSISGVSVINFLRSAYTNLHSTGIKKNGFSKISVHDFLALVKDQAKLFRIKEELLYRGLNDGFSGGEMKKLELLQMAVLSPKFVILDEIDTGLDIDALKVVANGISKLKNKGIGILVITHYQRILHYLSPDLVHVMIGGKIVTSGDATLAKKLEDNGYSLFESQNVKKK